MTMFGYRATDAAGKVSEGVLDAPEERSARDRLREMGRIPIRVWEASAPGRAPAASPSFAFSGRSLRKDVLPFLQGLKTFLAAGVPLDRSLEMLAGLFRGRPMGNVAASLLADVRGGNSLADAMRRAPGAPFHRFTVQMVTAGQATGSLSEALDQVHDFLTRSRDFRSTVLGSLMYPAILLGASVVSVAVLVVFVVPRFAGVFRTSGVLLPLPTRALLFFSTFLRQYGLLVLGAAALAGYLARAALRSRETRLSFDRSKLRWPWIGGILAAVETSRVARSLASLLSGGVPILSAFVIAREVSGNASFREGMEAARGKVQGGVKLARALSETTPFPETAIRMIAVGEETGRLEAMLASVADAYEETARRGLRDFLVLLEPAVILLMGLLVGFVVFSIFLAIFRLNEVPF